MSDSSQPKNSLDTFTVNGKSIDEIINESTIDLSGVGSAGDVYINPINSQYNSTYDYSSSTISTISLPGIGAIQPLTTSNTITITGLDTSVFSFISPVEFKDKFPDWDRVQKMCDEYPGLKIALDKFKTVYALVKDHYDTPKDKRPKP